jgi:nucleoporin NUP82
VHRSVPVSYLDTLAALVDDKLQALKDASVGERETLEAVTMANRLAAQQKYIDGLMSQATDNSASRTISLSPPTGGKPVLRQGPLLFNPAPRDLDDEDEDALASDLVVSGEEIGIVVIAWGSGRVDIGIELERPEARWESPQVCGPVWPSLEWLTVSSGPRRITVLLVDLRNSRVTDL